MSVEGKFLRHSDVSGCFVYEYRCEACDRKFTETCPEISEPAICHDCYSGTAMKKYHADYDKKKRRSSRLS